MSGLDPALRVCHEQVDGSVKEQWAPYSDEIGTEPCAQSHLRAGAGLLGSVPPGEHSPCVSWQ